MYNEGEVCETPDSIRITSLPRLHMLDDNLSLA